MIRTGDVIHNPITGESIRFVETAADSDGEHVVIDVLVEPNGFVATPHTHPYQTEAFEVLEGELTFKADGKKIVAAAGERSPSSPAPHISSGTPAMPPPGSAARSLRRCSSSS